MDRSSFRDHSLTITLSGAFLLTLVGMFFAGLSAENADLAKHGKSSIGSLEYLLSSHFLSALMENWESEFLQMGAYVALTAFLFQRGSAESLDPDKPASEQTGEEAADAPWPVRRGGWWKTLYSYSLSIALFGLFAIAFVVHWLSSASQAHEKALEHGTPTQDLWTHLLDAQLWFESFQNWQSEFFSTAVLVVLSIFLRHKGSPESKKVTDPTWKTGK